MAASILPASLGVIPISGRHRRWTNAAKAILQPSMHGDCFEYLQPVSMEPVRIALALMRWMARASPLGR
ncbi:hypothetical protein E4U55_007018 [Claviceps digitariae]|nr:hypothetical protein E4U55_007018 [Claviceps digitariae]